MDLNASQYAGLSLTWNMNSFIRKPPSPVFSRAEIHEPTGPHSDPARESNVVYMAEGLFSLIIKQRSTIISQWFDSAIQAYAADTASFIKSQKDPFANPVGSHTRKSVEALFDQLTGDMDAGVITSSLDPIMRIRAVQNLTPSRATAFIFSLKKTLRDIFGKDLQGTGLDRQLLELEARIDRLGLAAFDQYMACREKIYELKANETRNLTFKAFERAGLISKDP
jgi:hypothetical protein